MANQLNLATSFVTGDTVSAASLNNLINTTTVNAAIIKNQQEITTIGTADLLLIAPDSVDASLAPRKVTVQNLLDDGLTAGTFVSLNLTGALTYGTATGNRTVSTSATITTGTIPNLTAGTTTSTVATITNGTITTGLIPTLTAGTTTGTAGIFTSGTVATLNSTTGTITNLSTTLAGDFTISQGTGTLGTSGVTSGSYGSVSAIPFITVDTKGRVTAATTGTFSTIPADNSITFAKFVSTDWTASLGTANGTSGYQKLPSGLIVQWGPGSANTSGVTNTFSTAFPLYAYVVVATNNNQTNPPAPSLSSLSTTGFVATVSAGGPSFYYIALGQ